MLPNHTETETARADQNVGARRVHPVYVVAVLTLLAALFGILLLGQSTRNSAYLIADVPYWGMYKGTPITTNGAFVIYSFLQYWNDSRYSPLDIATLYPYALTATSSTQREQPFNTSITDFFHRNGYETQVVNFDNIQNVKNELREGTPLIISQQLATSAPSYVTTLRILLGYNDGAQHFVIHDNLYGNNYQLPYGDFEELIIEKKLLRVIPNAELATTLEPHQPYTYPPRHEAMDDPDLQQLLIDWNTIIAMRSIEMAEKERVRKETALWEKVINNESFDQLHPAARIEASLAAASLYAFRLSDAQKAVEITEAKMLPNLTLNLTQPFGAWERNMPPEYFSEPESYGLPRVFAAIFYMRLDQDRKADEQIALARQHYPNDGGALKEFFNDYDNGALDPFNLSPYTN